MALHVPTLAEARGAECQHLDERRPQSGGLAAVAADLLRRGRPRRASSIVRLAFRRDVSGPDEAALRLVLASVLVTCGDVTGAVVEARAVLAHPAAEPATVAAAQILLLRVMLLTGQRRAARRHAEAILAGTDADGNVGAMGSALLVLGQLAWERGGVADALSLIRAAAHRADGSPVAGASAHARVHLAGTLISIDKLDEARTLLCRHGWELDAGILWAPARSIVESRLLLASGRSEEAVAAATTGIDQARTMGAWADVAGAWAILAIAAIRRSDIVSTECCLARYRIESGPHATGWAPAAALWAHACLIDAEHGAGRTAAILQTLLDDPVPARCHFLELPESAPWWVRAFLNAGDRRRAVALCAVIWELARGAAGAPALTAAALHADGLLRQDPDRLLKAARRCRRPWAAASAAEDAAVASLAHGDASTARATWETALRGYIAVSASRDAERVRRQLSALDHRHGGSRGGARPISGWGSLTEAERRVAVAVGQGLTNAEAASQLFLSRHTVDFHLRQIFRKLDIHSRVELARLVALRGAPTEQGSAPGPAALPTSAGLAADRAPFRSPRSQP